MTPSPTPPVPDSDAQLVQSIGRHAARRAFWLTHGERSLAQNLAMIGALGWLVITPTLGGVFAGRWLDRHFAAGIVWTGALLTAGLVLGCTLAWRRIQDIQREDDR